MVVVASKPGQLGNRLLVFAHLIALGLSNGVPVANPAFDEFAPFFQGTAQDAMCRYPARATKLADARMIRRLIFHLAVVLSAILARLRLPFARVVRIGWEEPCDMSAPDFSAEVGSRPLVLLQGWLFRHEPGVERFQEEIREHFRPIRRVERRVEEAIGRARNGAEILVGIHVRRGDYASLHGGTYLHEWSTYAQVAKRICAELGGRATLAFLVCSNEPFRSEAFASLGCRVTPGPGNAVEDLYALAACDLLVGPPSTFTMWASFYGKTPLHMLRDPGHQFSDDSFQVFPMRGYPTGVTESGPTYW